MCQRRLIHTLSALLAVAILGAPARAADGPPPANVRLGVVKTMKVIEQRLVTGQIEPARRSLVAAEGAGRVTVGPGEPGTEVKAGQTVAQIDDALLKIDRDAAEAQVNEAESSIHEMEAALASVERDRKRIAQLLASDVARQKELDDAVDKESMARARLNVTNAVLAQMKAKRDRLNVQLEKTKVIAPFDAFITRKSTEVGQWVAPGDPVVELVETQRVKVKLEVPQFMIAQVPMDRPVEISFDAIDAKRSADVFSIVPDADPKARTFRVLFKLDNADGMLKPGMSASAQLPTGKVIEAMTVPRDAVRTTPTGNIVFAARGGLAIAVPVLIRFGEGDRFVVDAALNDGEQVVIEGNERLFPGQPLKVVGEKAPEAPAESAK
ncbi:MAG: efflux RND transporter periplasmic adaptor subunit [Planctomycetes bacterium]|nr:efflux RND transporter periplasmic adaptor subunit [Planctomycetota bacterium]